MKVRIFIKGDEISLQDIPLTEINTYLTLLSTHDLLDEEGNVFTVHNVQIDIHQNIVDVSCEPRF